LLTDTTPLPPKILYTHTHTRSFLFANHEDVKPLELAAVPLSTSVGELKRRLREQWPAGLPTDDGSGAVAAVIVPSPQQGQQGPLRRRRPSGAAQPPQTPLTVVSSSSPSASPAVVAAETGNGSGAGGGAGGGAATDDEDEDEDEEGLITPPAPAMSLTTPRAVEPGRIRLICLGRGLDGDEKTLKEYHVPVFEEHATPVQVAIRPSGASGGGGGSVRRSPKALEEGAGQQGNGAGEEVVDPLVCCGCSVM
jgi:hypothetical protein